MKRQDIQVAGLRNKDSEHSEYRTEVPTLMFIFGNGVVRTAEV